MSSSLSSRRNELEINESFFIEKETRTPVLLFFFLGRIETVPTINCREGTLVVLICYTPAAWAHYIWAELSCMIRPNPKRADWQGGFRADVKWDWSALQGARTASLRSWAQAQKRDEFKLKLGSEFSCWNLPKTTNCHQGRVGSVEIAHAALYFYERFRVSLNQIILSSAIQKGW